MIYGDIKAFKKSGQLRNGPMQHKYQIHKSISRLISVITNNMKQTEKSEDDW